MDNLMISIAEDFSRYPAGRQDVDGPFNGTKFRQNLLMPLLREAISKNLKVVVSLDGLLTCGSSFLDSAFGGLVRDEHLTRDDVLDHLAIEADGIEFHRYRDAALRYIRSARLSPN